MKHMWVAMQYTPIEVEVQTDGSLHTFTGELADEIAREDSILVCFHCGETLTTQNHEEECPGKLEPKNIDENLDL